MNCILDTNVVSELRKTDSGRADANVVAWAQRQPTSSLFISAIVIFELERGVLRLERREAPEGSVMRHWIDHKILPSFADRILPVDIAVARRRAALHVPRTRPERDAMIAATALVHGMTVVTRDIVDFADMGVRLINPWNPA